ncbi:MAG TPA: alpha-E domain-containing protein [Candidatus Binatia bacterium]|nr:alpha-E domain-containing protein [Candidatus Binatia bacterium]
MLRRIADSLFWAARSLERAEWRARLVDVDYRLLVETPVELSQPWTPLLAIAGEEAAFAERWGEPDETKILEFFLFDRGNPSSIRACIETARENTRTLRHTISSELWLDLNTLYLDSQRWSLRELESGGLFGFFSDLRERFYRLSGIVSATLPRDLGYDFLTLGTMLERADNVTRLLDVKYHVLLPDVADVGGPIDLLQWAAVLRSASGLEAYRRAHGNAIRLDRVVDLLLFDATFARSARFCVERVGGALARIAGGTPSASRRAADELAERLACASAADAIAGGLHEFVVGAQSQCADVASAVFDDYLRFE